MATAEVMTTALPRSVEEGAERHLTAFVTHKLEAAADTTLADCPAVETWVKTLGRGAWEVTASTLPAPVPATVVSAPDQQAWSALIPPSTPVRGYPTHPPVLDAPWQSYRAHAMDEIAGYLHIGAMVTAPLARPRADNPIARQVLQTMTEVHGGARTLREMLDARPGKPRMSKSMLDAMMTLGGQLRRDDDQGGRPPDNAMNAHLRTLAEDERRLTEWLDGMVADGYPRDGMLGVMVDVHAARRYYQRPEDQVGYEEQPVEGATTPRPENDEPDVHQLASSAGGTPALLRALGLAVDLTVAAEHLPALASATWVSVRFVPDPADVLTITEPPRTSCGVVDGVWQVTASGEWVGGRLPLGDPELFRVLALDPDATALATEQNLRNVTGEVASELNGDKANGAPTAMRSTGFSLARVNRVDSTRERLDVAGTLKTPPGSPTTLTYGNVVRGVRIEVREGAGPWRSLHERRVDVTADDGVALLTDVPDEGFLPLTSMSRSGAASETYYLHEVFAGWDGWSLSAPRPGKVVVQAEDGSEQVLDEPPVGAGEPQLGRIRSRVEPGSLPRLRYGHSYAFRACGVDLAGDEIPDPVPVAVDPDAFGRRLRDWRDAVAAHRTTTLGDQLRASLAQSRPAAVAGFAEARTTRPRVDVIRPDLVREVAGPSLVLDEARLSRTQARLADMLQADARRRATVSELDRVRDAVAAAAADLDDLWVHPGLLVEPEVPQAEPPAAQAHPIATAPMPFLRWHPVPPPTLVAKHELGLGESLQRLVITGAQPSERHVAPPKTTQLEAELHGELDFAIGSTDPAVQRQAYAWSLRERGTLLDEWIPDLDQPGSTVKQTDMSLASRPGADPATAVTLADITAERDTPLGEGQYVVHGVEQLVLPYLPDPLAAGLALVFLDAGAPHTLPEPRVLSAVVIPFHGTWPRVEPLRLVLQPGAELSATVAGNVVTVTLPAGEQVRVAMSSSVREEDLAALGLWRVTEAVFGGASVEVVELLRRAAASGWTWWLTPSEELRLVHATPRPASPPALYDLAVLARPASSTVAGLVAITEVHGASTARIALEGTWSEWVDDVTTPAPVRVDRRDVPARSQVLQGERYGVLLPWEDLDPDNGIPAHKAIHAFADTHHRRVTYTLVASTRYAEFFPPEQVAGEDDPASRSEPVVLAIPSSARPAAPVVTETVPLILWEDGTEPDQPFARRRTRRGGARLWMDRPWYSSGDGELLAVVLGDALPHATSSRWGRDPGLVATAEVASSATPPLLEAIDLLFTGSDAIAEPGTEVDVPRRPGGPAQVAPPQPLVDVKGSPLAGVIGYEPEFHPDRGQWFVDIALDVKDQLWPFVRLAVARYQPVSLPRCSLSPVVMTDWVQPLPARTATLSRPDAGHVQVTVSGAAALYRTPPRGASADAPPELDGVPEDSPLYRSAVTPLDGALLWSRLMVATVQERGPSDLEWQDHAVLRLPAVGQHPDSLWQVTWSDQLELPVPIEPETPPAPSGQTQYRVLIEELEIMEADPAPDTRTVRYVTRVVYADTFDL